MRARTKSSTRQRTSKDRPTVATARGRFEPLPCLRIYSTPVPWFALERRRAGQTAPTTCDHTAPRSETLGSNAGMSAGDGRTIEQRIRISRRGGGSTRCSGSESGFGAEISLHARRRLQHLQRPTPSHLGPNAPHASRRGDGHLAHRGRSGLTILEAPTLRARCTAT